MYGDHSHTDEWKWNNVVLETSWCINEIYIFFLQLIILSVLNITKAPSYAYDDKTRHCSILSK